MFRSKEDDEHHKIGQTRDRPQRGWKERMKQDGFPRRCGWNDHHLSPIHLRQALQESLAHAAFEVVDSRDVRKVTSNDQRL